MQHGRSTKNKNLNEFRQCYSYQLWVPFPLNSIPPRCSAHTRTYAHAYFCGIHACLFHLCLFEPWCFHAIPANSVNMFVYARCFYMQVLETGTLLFATKKVPKDPVSQNRKQHNQRFHDKSCSCSFALFVSVTACSFLCETAAEKKTTPRNHEHWNLVQNWFCECGAGWWSSTWMAIINRHVYAGLSMIIYCVSTDGSKSPKCPCFNSCAIVNQFSQMFRWPTTMACYTRKTNWGPLKTATGTTINATGFGRPGYFY